MDYSFFIEFLQENNCSEEFNRNFQEYNDHTSFDRQLWEAIEEKHLLFGQVFNWKESKEGRKYWSKIDAKWHDLSRKTILWTQSDLQDRRISDEYLGLRESLNQKKDSAARIYKTEIIEKSSCNYRQSSKLAEHITFLAVFIENFCFFEIFTLPLR